MIRLFRWLIWGDAHLHEWEPYGAETRVFADSDTSRLPLRYRQTFRCKHCGKIKIFEV